MVRIALRVEVDLDAIPGAMYDAKDAEAWLGRYLNQSIPHYNPHVFLMPMAHVFSISYESVKGTTPWGDSQPETCRFCGGTEHEPVTDGMLPDNPWGATEEGIY